MEKEADEKTRTITQHITTRRKRKSEEGPFEETRKQSKVSLLACLSCRSQSHREKEGEKRQEIWDEKGVCLVRFLLRQPDGSRNRLTKNGSVNEWIGNLAASLGLIAMNRAITGSTLI